MRCGSPQKTGLLSGQRRRMLASHRTNLRLMGLEIATTRDFPARIESGRGVFPHVCIGVGAHRGVREPLGEISEGDFLACWRSGLDIKRL